MIASIEAVLLGSHVSIGRTSSPSLSLGLSPRVLLSAFDSSEYPHAEKSRAHTGSGAIREFRLKMQELATFSRVMSSLSGEFSVKQNALCRKNLRNSFFHHFHLVHFCWLFSIRFISQISLSRTWSDSPKQSSAHEGEKSAGKREKSPVGRMLQSTFAA